MCPRCALWSLEKAKQMLDVVAERKITASKDVFSSLAEIPQLIRAGHSEGLADNDYCCPTADRR